MHHGQLYIGLMSGTSADAIDAALVDLQGAPRLLASLSTPLPPSLRQQIHALCQPGDNEIDRMGALDIQLGQQFAQCALALLAHARIPAANVIAIGSHGQTIRHRPPRSPEGTFTLQIGDPNSIAELTGITTVADFRRRDMAAGGQGAPLVPAFHAAVFRSPMLNRAVVNIGGMANITWLPAEGEVIGFDTGPGNVLMDVWIQEQQQLSYDRDGRWAATGQVNTDLLASFLADPFFSQPYPKSTGREYFNRAWLERHLASCTGDIPPEDVQASLLELTVSSISDSIRQLEECAHEVVVCGGGAFNSQLMARLERRFPGSSLTSSAAHGVDPQWVESMAFAWLAKQTLEHKPGNLCAVTGAKKAVILGGIYPGG